MTRTLPPVWQCPVEGHRDRTGLVNYPLATVEWDGDVACCLATGCGRRSDDPIPPQRVHV